MKIKTESQENYFINLSGGRVAGAEGIKMDSKERAGLVAAGAMEALAREMDAAGQEYGAGRIRGMAEQAKRWAATQTGLKDDAREFRMRDIGDGNPVAVMVCPKCGIAPSNVDDCGEFGNPECPYFGIGLDEYERRFGGGE